jgi:hypothetical protein
MKEMSSMNTSLHTNEQTKGNGETQQHEEGTVAKTIEQQTAKLPSDVFLWAAVGSMGASAMFQLLGKKKVGLFIGEWVSPFLLLGVYNKIVKTQGSDQSH